MYGLHPDASIELFWANLSGVPLGLLLFSSFIFLRYKDNKVKATIIVTSFVLLLTCVFLFVLLYLNTLDRIVTGVTGAVFTVLLFTGPLTKALTAYRKRNHEMIPLFITVNSFCAACCWMTFGIGKEDPIIIYVNLIGICVTSIELLIKMEIAFCRKLPVVEEKKTELVENKQEMVKGQAEAETIEGKKEADPREIKVTLTDRVEKHPEIKATLSKKSETKLEVEDTHE